MTGGPKKVHPPKRVLKLTLPFNKLAWSLSGWPVGVLGRILNGIVRASRQLDDSGRDWKNSLLTSGGAGAVGGGRQLLHTDEGGSDLPPFLIIRGGREGCCRQLTILLLQYFLSPPPLAPGCLPAAAQHTLTALVYYYT